MTLKNFFALALITIGIIIALASGICAIDTIGQPFYTRHIQNMLLPLFAGGIPMLIGLCIALNGRLMFAKKHGANTPPNAENDIRSFYAGILMTFAAIITLLSGGCTLLFLPCVGFIAIMVGFLPFIFGIAMFFIGAGYRIKN